MSDEKHRIVRFPGGREYYEAFASEWRLEGDRYWMFGVTAYSDKSPEDAQRKAAAAVAAKMA